VIELDRVLCHDLRGGLIREYGLAAWPRSRDASPRY